MALTNIELQTIKNLLKKEPNEVERGMFEVMWSEHCSYKNSKPLLKELPSKGENVIQGPGENAGVISLGDGDAVAFKIESHNHPSAIEPYQGASTGVGGIIRDVISMGARPTALLNSLRFSPLKTKRTRYLFGGVVSGIGGYGNCVGVPTVAGEVYFDPSYNENPLVNAMCVGTLKEDELYRGETGSPGNLLLLVGSKTGRDGILGASFASEALSGDNASDRPSVQVGDPFMGKLLIETCQNLLKTESSAIVGLQDLGAGGLVSAASEMASKSDMGVTMDVSQVPLREENMTPYEIMLSESQERMLFIVKESQVERLRDKVKELGLDASVIGEVIEEKKLIVNNRDITVANVPPRALTDNVPEKLREIKFPQYLTEQWKQEPQVSQKLQTMITANNYSYENLIINMLNSPNIGSKQWIYEQFDYTVGANTVKAPKSNASVVRLKGKNKGIAINCDGNSRYVYADPKRGAKIAVCEASRNLVTTGAKPLGLTNCLNFGNPEKPQIYYQLANTIKGMKEACETLGIPVTGGNVSLYNEGENEDIKPTPVIGMVGLVEDLSKIMSADFKDEGDMLVLLGETYEELGASELGYLLTEKTIGRTPEIDLYKEQNLQEFILKIINSELVKSCDDLSDGGLAVSLTKSCILGNIGCTIDLPTDKSMLTWLFSESQSRVLVSVSSDKVDSLVELAKKDDIPSQVIGTINESRLSITKGDEEINLGINDLKNSWEGAIPWIMD
nr:phosphoribosylformylglycinamidine synthase subunit PurL [Natranaerobius trueperi]